jgi:hypothetical protein
MGGPVVEAAVIGAVIGAGEVVFGEVPGVLGGTAAQGQEDTEAQNVVTALSQIFYFYPVNLPTIFF